jgi:hypothetical protein
MAKQATVAKQVEVATQPKVSKQVKPEFEFKDRTYFLITGNSPLVFTLPCKHSSRKPLLYFDKELGSQREIRYATNQKSIFADEQMGTSTLGRIILRNGQISVPKEQQNLQKLLSIYHPLKDLVYKELDEVKDSENHLDWIELELEALIKAKSLDIDHAEAILRSEYGEGVTNLSSSELKRDIMLFAKKDPVLFLDLASDDHIQLRNVGAKAVEQGFLQLSSDQRTFPYGDGGRKLMTIPFDEHPYSALASYFKTDDGMEVYKAILKKLR